MAHHRADLGSWIKELPDLYDWPQRKDEPEGEEMTFTKTSVVKPQTGTLSSNNPSRQSSNSLEMLDPFFMRDYEGLGLVGLASSAAPCAKSIYEDRLQPAVPTTNDYSFTSTYFLENELDSFIEDLEREQASSSVRSNSQHTAIQVPSIANRPQVKASRFHRSVSHPILSSSVRLRSSGASTPTKDLDTSDLRSDLCSLHTSSREQQFRPAALDFADRSAQIQAPLQETERNNQSKAYNCEVHQGCVDGRNIENTHHENEIMSEERNKIISNNRSLRNIKNELETLAENGAISDAAYDEIMKHLPAESSLGAPARGARAAAPNASMEKLSMNDNPPPAYNTTGPPALPSRKTSTPAPKELMRATALYTYETPGDCCFKAGEEIIVMKKVNDDWWVGKNATTGSEGAFPKTYVQPLNNTADGQYNDEKASHGGYQAPVRRGPPAPGPSDPYKSAVPPMQISEQPVEKQPGKGGEMGKKFGKKLGNAAIFGAGATIGGKIVNGIF